MDADVELCMHQHDKQHVLFHDQEPNETASEMVTETISTMDTHSSADFDLMDSVCEQFNVDRDTLYAQVTKHHMEVNKEKHNHWRPPKGFISPSQ